MSSILVEDLITSRKDAMLRMLPALGDVGDMPRCRRRRAASSCPSNAKRRKQAQGRAAAPSAAYVWHAKRMRLSAGGPAADCPADDDGECKKAGVPTRSRRKCLRTARKAASAGAFCHDATFAAVILTAPLSDAVLHGLTTPFPSAAVPSEPFPRRNASRVVVYDPAFDRVASGQGAGEAGPLLLLKPSIAVVDLVFGRGGCPLVHVVTPARQAQRLGAALEALLQDPTLASASATATAPPGASAGAPSREPSPPQPRVTVTLPERVVRSAPAPPPRLPAAQAGAAATAAASTTTKAAAARTTTTAAAAKAKAGATSTTATTTAKAMAAEPAKATAAAAAATATEHCRRKAARNFTLLQFRGPSAWRRVQAAFPAALAADQARAPGAAPPAETQSLVVGGGFSLPDDRRSSRCGGDDGVHGVAWDAASHEDREVRVLVRGWCPSWWARLSVSMLVVGQDEVRQASGDTLLCVSECTERELAADCPLVGISGGRSPAVKPTSSSAMRGSRSAGGSISGAPAAAGCQGHRGVDGGEETGERAAAASARSCRARLSSGVREQEARRHLRVASADADTHPVETTAGHPVETTAVHPVDTLHPVPSDDVDPAVSGAVALTLVRDFLRRPASLPAATLDALRQNCRSLAEQPVVPISRGSHVLHEARTVYACLAVLRPVKRGSFKRQSGGILFLPDAVAVAGWVVFGHYNEKHGEPRAAAVVFIAKETLPCLEAGAPLLYTSAGVSFLVEVVRRD